MRRTTKEKVDSARELTEMVQKACLIAKDAVFNAEDYIEHSSSLAYVAVKQCEKELDDIERDIDESLPEAITEVTESEARQLLACLKFITDLERIGDLMWSVTQRVQQIGGRLAGQDQKYFLEMAEILRKMLEQVYQGFKNLDVGMAESVLKTDTQIDQVCHSVFRRHLHSTARRQSAESTTIMLMAQAFERAGDHAKNLAEEVVHLVRGHSLRHKSRGRSRAE